MRIDSIRELELGLNELEKYIDYNQACNKSISDAESIETPNPDSLTSLIGISNRFRRKKVFEYNAYIISLYGLFERFIENILQDYLNDICSTLIDYRKFPEQIKNNNLALNVDLLKNLSNPKYQNLNKENLIKTLNDGFNEHKAVLNVDAFKHHPYNFKQSIVSEYFGNIGITGLNNELKVYSPLKDLLNEKYGNTANINSDVLFQVIDDLSQRRNDVAHGVENIELLNITILKEYIKYISSYCKSIFEILLNKSLGYVFNEQPENFEKINVINNSIVCGVIQDLAFSKSDFVLIEKPDTNRPKYVLSKIDDIQINNVSHDKLTITDKKLVGIKVSDYCKNNYMFKIITAPNTQYT